MTRRGKYQEEIRREVVRLVRTHLILTHLRASRFVEPDALLEEARAIFDGPVDVARDLDAFDF